MYRISSSMRWHGRALLAGLVLATLWLNLAPASYYDMIEWRLADLTLPQAMAPFPVSLTPRGLVTGVLMALVGFVLGKEAWEALMFERATPTRRLGTLPLAMAGGAILGGILVWLVIGSLIETAEEATFGAGWTVAAGADTLLAYTIGRRLFPAGHPALYLVLLVAILCDIAGLLLTGVIYPPTGLRPFWLILPVVAGFGVWLGFGRLPAPGATERQRQRGLQLWPYVVAGAISMVGVLAAGLPGALGLMPIIPAIPHAARGFGLFADAERVLHDPLSRLARIAEWPMPLILFLFGVTCGGIDLGAWAPTTATVLAAFWIGKPLGLVAGAAVWSAATRASLPEGISPRDLAAVAALTGIGLTVPILSLGPALPGGAMTEAARLGLALSLLAGGVAALIRAARPR